MYKHLFVPIDGSELSDRAIAAALDLAVSLGARVTGFIVEPDPSFSALSTDVRRFRDNLEAFEQKRDEHAHRLLAGFGERAQARGVEFSGVHATGRVDDAIVTESERVGADLIVMVTHGRSALGELVYGSQSKRVLARTKLPVLVLH